MFFFKRRSLRPLGQRRVLTLLASLWLRTMSRRLEAWPRPVTLCCCPPTPGTCRGWWPRPWPSTRSSTPWMLTAASRTVRRRTRLPPPDTSFIVCDKNSDANDDQCNFLREVLLNIQKVSSLMITHKKTCIFHIVCTSIVLYVHISYNLQPCNF